MVKIDLAVVVDGSVASLDHFYGAEKRVSHKRWDNVNGAFWFTQFVVQFVDFSGSCCGTIGRWKMAIKIVFVGIDGAEGRNAWEVASLSLTAKGVGGVCFPYSSLF